MNADSSPIPEKQSIREAILHLFARYREMRPLFLAAARPMKVEWKMSPYFGVLPLVFRALGEEHSVQSLQSEISTTSAKAAPPLPSSPSLQSEPQPQAGLGLLSHFMPTHSSQRQREGIQCR